MKLKNKILSLLLSLAIIISFSPTLAFADDVQEATDQNSNETVAVEETVDDVAPNTEETQTEKTEEALKERAMELKANDNEYEEISIEAENQGDLFSDGIKKLIINDKNYYAGDYEYKVSLAFRDYESAKEYEVENPESFSVEGKEITLYGEIIWKELELSGADTDSVYLQIFVDAVQGETILASGFGFTNVYEPYVDYEEGLPWSNEELTGSYFEFKKKVPVPYYSGTIDNEDHEGEYNTEIVGVKVNGKEFSYDTEKNLWRFPIKAGANEVVITYALVDIKTGQATGETEDYEFSIIGLSDIYSLEEEITDVNYIDDFAAYAIPGDTVTFTARGQHSFLGSNGETKTDYNFNYKWTIEKGADFADIVKVETDPSKKWSKVTVKVKDSIDPFYYDEDNEIEINVAANLVSTSNANNVYQNTYRPFIVTTEYSEISLSPDVPANLEVGKSVTITPSLYWHWVLWDDVFTNTGKSIVSKLDGAKYAWVFDEKVVDIKNQGASISSDDAEEGLYEGSFTITKKRNQGTTIQLVAFLYNDEDKVWEEEVRKEIYLYETEPITNAQVSGIADKTYNGQAQIQNLDIVEKYVEDGEEFLYTLTEGNDYEVTYSNNVNAGKATVTIIGLNSYTGSIVKTFNIAKANQSPSINAAAKKVKLQKVKKKKQNVQPLTVTGAKGTISYKGVGANKKSKKALKINAKTGKITVKKGTKKGTYKMNVTVTVSGNANYNPYTVTKTVVIKVK